MNVQFMVDIVGAPWTVGSGQWAVGSLQYSVFSVQFRVQ